MEKNLNDNIAIITGGSSGIGKAIARELTKQGAKVIIADLKTGYDISDYEDIDKLLREVTKKYKKINILINNVGVGSGQRIFTTLTEDLEKVFKTNVFGPFLLTQKVGQIMKRQKEGNIIFITSIHQDIPLGDIAYSSSKAAVAMMVKEFALELSKYNIRVNGIAPGAVRSRREIDKRFPFVPLKGLRGNVEDIAASCAFLVSDQAKYITGEIIFVDGGLSLKNFC